MCVSRENRADRLLADASLSRGNRGGTLVLDAFARGTGCIGYGSIPLRGRKPPRASHAN